MEQITKPLYEYQASEQEKLRDEIRTKANAHKVRETRLQELQRKAAKEDDTIKRAELMGQAEQVIKEMAENPVPVLPLLVMDDTTAEALAHAMAQNGERMAIFSAEAGLFDIMGGRYTDGKAQNLDIFLKGHAGDACSTHRIGREPVVMLNPALTLGLAVQSDVLSDLAVVKRFRGRGLLARILFVLCPSQVGYRDRQQERIPKDLFGDYRKHISELMDIPLNQGLICLSAAAETAWDSFYGDVERLMRPGERLEHLTDWGSKLPGAVARISGLLHFAEHREKGLILPISESTVLSACVIGAYYLEHALAVFGVMREDPRIKAAKTILDYISQHPEPFKVRVLIEKKRVFKTVEDVMPGIKVLLERGYIRERAGEYQGKGRPESTTYDVNPRISSLDKPSAEYSKSHEKSNSAVFC